MLFVIGFLVGVFVVICFKQATKSFREGGLSYCFKKDSEKCCWLCGRKMDEGKK